MLSEQHIHVYLVSRDKKQCRELSGRGHELIGTESPIDAINRLIVSSKLLSPDVHDNESSLFYISLKEKKQILCSSGVDMKLSIV